MYKYIYDGSVYEFNNCVNENWHGETIALNEKIAKRNLTYQYKRQTNRARDSKIRLSGKVQKVG